ncbi:uncharacterized protein FMAN_09779 [Fusarium mangiferae]|uniref:Uncharacterized protein n=1 Tax=Fusarium mangiferae TaxID=192010 RepID=A0A1L7TVY1_FUSMA|nr:uncharacterized protein FMAN_09779 [Fusarium mangiferae]CVL00273.1 uncharacterized protein FMAN_09779 [Fusarium mangiferae]
MTGFQAAANNGAAIRFDSNSLEPWRYRRLGRTNLKGDSQTRVDRICHKLLGVEPLQTFNGNHKKVIADWNLLKSKTDMPNLDSSSDPRIIESFKVIDLVLSGKEGSTLLRRLAYVRLMDLFSFVEGVVRKERQSRRVIRERYYRDASIALDIYMSAQEDTSNPDRVRKQLLERKRIGRSWKEVSRKSPLLVLMYSEAAESVL